MKYAPAFRVRIQVALAIAAFTAAACSGPATQTDVPSSGSPTSSLSSSSSPNTSPAGPGSSATAACGEPVELKAFSFFGDLTTKDLDTLLNAFKAKTGHTVVWETSYSETFPAQLQARINGRADFDVIFMRTSDFPRYRDSGAFLDITGEPFLADIAAGAVEAGTVEGKTYGFALGQYAIGVLYNKAIFAQLGITVPQDWDEFMTAAKKLSEAGYPIAQSAKEGWTNQYVYHNTLAKIYADRPTFFDDLRTGAATWDDPEFVAAIQRYADLVAAGAYAEGSVSLGYAEAASLMHDGKASMWIMGNWGLNAATPKEGTANPELGVFPLPINAAGQPPAAAGAIFDSMGLATSWGSKQEAARCLIGFLASPEGAVLTQPMLTTFSTVAGVPADNIHPQAGIWQAALAEALPFPPNLCPSIGTSGTATTLLQGIAAGTASVADVVAGYQKLQLEDNKSGC